MNGETPHLPTTTIKIGEIDLELFEAGSGAPLIWLHGGQGFNPAQPFVSLLAAKRRLIVPLHPGFGKSSLPDWLDRMDDIAHVYLELLDRLDLGGAADIVGASIGGWIAAEMATKVPERIRRLVMIGPVGVKVGGPDKLDIPDIFAMSQDDAAKLLFHDPAKMKPDITKMSDEELAAHVSQPRDAGAAGLGAVDAQSQAQASAASSRGCRRCSCAARATAWCRRTICRPMPSCCRTRAPSTIPAAGHAPHLEQPQALVKVVLEFLDGDAT